MSLDVCSNVKYLTVVVAVRSVGEDYEYILPDAGLNKIARTMLSGVKDSTARAALAKHLRRRLLVEATKAMGITKV